MVIIETPTFEKRASPSEEPFLRKVSPINNYKLLYKYYGYEELFLSFQIILMHQTSEP